MSYQYRGVAYQPTVYNVTTTSQVIGQYRGAVVSRSVVTEVPAQPMTRELTYRGVRYGAAAATVTTGSLTPALA